LVRFIRGELFNNNCFFNYAAYVLHDVCGENMKIKTVIKLSLSVFSLYLLYQVLRKLLGGSWGEEELILALVGINLGWTMMLQKDLSQHLGQSTGNHKLIDHRLTNMERKLSRLEVE